MNLLVQDNYFLLLINKFISGFSFSKYSSVSSAIIVNTSASPVARNIVSITISAPARYAANVSSNIPKININIKRCIF